MGERGARGVARLLREFENASLDSTGLDDVRTAQHDEAQNSVAFEDSSRLVTALLRRWTRCSGYGETPDSEKAAAARRSSDRTDAEARQQADDEGQAYQHRAGSSAR